MAPSKDKSSKTIPLQSDDVRQKRLESEENERIAEAEKPKRLESLDAYRGFIMLAMASGGFAFSAVAASEAAMNQFDGTEYETYTGAWKTLWQTLAYQFSHTAWTGCSFWDLIQPSFMFMVGVAMPYSYARRTMFGQSHIRMFLHVLWRSFVLVALGVFLSSNSSTDKQTDFIFTNVLAQIGLGYSFLYLFNGRSLPTQFIGICAILGGYWYFFYQYTMPEGEYELVTQYLVEVHGADESEWTQFDRLAAHWNKHTNAAASVDRDWLNRFPRGEEEWNGKKYWVNGGGYQTLNFVPSLATMLFGLMAGTVLRSRRKQRKKFKWLMGAGAICFVVSMAIDTTIWPISSDQLTWSLCPIVKRIWTPSWAVFSSGWTFWMLAMFYLVIDILGFRWWSFPLKVVGMNSIAMYCMSQLIKPWVGKSLKTHLTTVDAYLNIDPPITYYLFSEDYPYADMWQYAARLFVLWLICLWLYRQKIFIRI